MIVKTLEKQPYFPVIADNQLYQFRKLIFPLKLRQFKILLDKYIDSLDSQRMKKINDKFTNKNNAFNIPR